MTVFDIFKRKSVADNPRSWNAEKDGTRYSAHLVGIKLEIFKDTGFPETSGGGSVIARHFIERQKWKMFFVDIYGKAQYEEMHKAVSSEYEKFRANPTEYNRRLKLDN